MTYVLSLLPDDFDQWCMSISSRSGVVGSGEVEVGRSAATEALLKKLVEAEVDGQSIADQAAGFTDAIQRLREVLLLQMRPIATGVARSVVCGQAATPTPYSDSDRY